MMFRKYIPGRSWLYSAVPLLISLVLYSIGIKFLLVIVSITALTVSLPYPSILKSLCSRFLTAMLLFYALYQVAAVIQFLIFPHTGFKVAAVLIVSTILFGSWLANIFGITNREIRIVSKNDVWALVTASFFVVPLFIFCFATHGLVHIAGIGSIQGIDGANHYSAIADTAYDQRITYQKRNNFPIGFHVTTAFVENSLSINQSKLSWRMSAKLYLTQYLIAGLLMAYMLFTVSEQIAEKVQPNKQSHAKYLIMSVSIGLPLCLFYSLPFLYNGFLSYFYIAATIICGLIYALEITVPKTENDPYETWWLFGYLLLAFGAAMNWPLLVPALLLTGALYWLPDNHKNLLSVKNYYEYRTVIVLIGFILLLLPVYFQMRYSTTGTSQSVNQTGALKTLHYGVLLMSVAVVAYGCFAKVTQPIRDYCNNILVPLFILITALVAYQYFTIGEVRYYAIKSAFLIEILTLAIVASCLALAYSRQRTVTSFSVLSYCIVLPAAFLLLLSVNANPLQDDRSLFRSYSGQSKPLYFDQDVAAFEKLGTNNDITKYNATLLHYDAMQGKFYADMQIPYWAGMMQYGAERDEAAAMTCNLALYKNLLFGSFTNAEQKTLIKEVDGCAAMAKKAGIRYYVVTDAASAAKVEAAFGNRITIQLD